jgi:thermitase
MKVKLKALILVFAASLFSMAAFAQIPGAKRSADYVPGEVLVKFRSGGVFTDRVAHMMVGATVVQEWQFIGVQRVKLPENVSVEDAITFYTSLKNVEFAEPNYIAHAMFTPNDAYWNVQWGAQLIQCAPAWDLTQGNPSIVIAALDTGVQFSNPDIAGKTVSGGWDYANNDSDPSDDNGHGTNTAGIAAAATNNSVGIAGVGFNCKILPIKVLDASGSGTYGWIISGIDRARTQGAKVINMSLGGGSPSSSLEAAVNAAWNAGIVLCAAAGNSGTTQFTYPAAYTNCIAVGASTQSDGRASFSNYGSSWVDVAAPGVNIVGPWNDGNWYYVSGTSQATPHVAGQAALIFSRFGASTPAATVRQRIEDNTDPVQGGQWVAKGRINVLRSLQGQSTQDVLPSSFTVTRGAYMSGATSDLHTNDGTYVRVQARAQTEIAAASVEIETVGTAPTGTVTQLQFKYDGRVSGSPTRQRIELFNYQSNSWETVDERDGPAADQTVTITITTNPGRFVQSGTRQMKARIGYHDRGVTFPAWDGYYDWAIWTVTVQ